MEILLLGSLVLQPDDVEKDTEADEREYTGDIDHGAQSSPYVSHMFQQCCGFGTKVETLICSTCTITVQLDSLSSIKYHLLIRGLVESIEFSTLTGRTQFGVVFLEFTVGLFTSCKSEVGISTSNGSTSCMVLIEKRVDVIGRHRSGFRVCVSINTRLTSHLHLQINHITLLSRLCVLTLVRSVTYFCTSSPTLRITSSRSSRSFQK